MHVCASMAGTKCRAGCMTYGQYERNSVFSRSRERFPNRTSEIDQQLLQSVWTLSQSKVSLCHKYWCKYLCHVCTNNIQHCINKITDVISLEWRVICVALAYSKQINKSKNQMGAISTRTLLFFKYLENSNCDFVFLIYHLKKSFRAEANRTFLSYKSSESPGLMLTDIISSITDFSNNMASTYRYSLRKRLVSA